MTNFEFEITYPVNAQLRDQTYKYDIKNRRVATVRSSGEFYPSAFEKACIGLEKFLGRETHNDNSGNREVSYKRLTETEASLGGVVVYSEAQVLESGYVAIYDEATYKYEGKGELDKQELQEAA